MTKAKRRFRRAMRECRKSNCNTRVYYYGDCTPIDYDKSGNVVECFLQFADEYGYHKHPNVNNPQELEYYRNF